MCIRDRSIVLLIIYIAKAILNYIIQYWGHIVGVRMQGDMRRDFFRHLQKLPFAFFDENKTGAVMSRMINDLMDVSELAHHGPEDFFLSKMCIRDRDYTVQDILSNLPVHNSEYYLIF